jgi:hypothetical protein
LIELAYCVDETHRGFTAIHNCDSLKFMLHGTIRSTTFSTIQ